MRTNTWASALAAVGFTGLLACAGEITLGQLTPVEELEEGINILDADPATGVLGAYREGGDVVYYETRAGFTKPAIFREAFPEEPAQEIDMRFVDKNGLTFYVQRGGDQFVDPTWIDSINETFTTPVADADRELDFALAKAAGQAFPAIAEPTLADHTFHLRAHGERLLPIEDPLLIAPTEQVESVARPESSYATASESGWWYLAGGMSHSSVALFGSHGSVQYWAYDTSWKFRMNFCNHGSCTGSHQCYTYSNGWLYSPYISYEGSTSTGTVSGGCTTGYNWNGGTGKHNSNDDCAYELWQVKEGKTSTSKGNSTSFGWQASNKYYACSTNGGRWTAPANCP
jgi:hypothetical protein